MSFEKVLLETPAGQRFIAEKERQVAEATVRNGVLRVLRRRFGSVPEDLAGQLAAIREQQKLEDLHDLAVVCPDLEAFRQALSPP